MLFLRNLFFFLSFLLVFVADAQNSDSLLILGQSALKTNLQQADSIFSKAILASKAENNLPNQLKAQKLKGYALYYKGEFSEAISSFNEGLNIAINADSNRYIFDLNNALGACYKYVGDLESAISHFNDGYEIAIEINDKENIAKASKAYAFLKRRGYVIPEDVRAVAMDILRHRIGISYEAEAENVTQEDIVNEILNKVEVP